GRASVWSAWSLLLLFGGISVVVGDVKAPASRTHCKRFAELGGAWYVAPAFGVRGACSRFTKRGQQCWRCESAGKPGAVQTLRGTRRQLAPRARIRSAFRLRLSAL